MISSWEQREEVYEQVAAIRPLLQKKFLLSLLNGESSPDEIMHQMSVLELPFQMTMFGTFLLQIDDYYSLPYSEEEKQEFRAQIQAQITAYANEQVSCITAEVNDETILCVCNLQAEENEETAKQIFRSYLAGDPGWDRRALALHTDHRHRRSLLLSHGSAGFLPEGQNGTVLQDLPGEGLHDRYG